MEITDKKILDLLIKKGDLISEARELTKQIDELEQRRHAIGMRVQKIKDKVVPLINKLILPQLGEFEQIGTVDMVDGVCKAEIYDAVEEFKKHFKEQKANESNQS